MLGSPESAVTLAIAYRVITLLGDLLLAIGLHGLPSHGVSAIRRKRPPVLRPARFLKTLEDL